MRGYGQGPIAGKIFCWIFMTTLAAISIQIATLVGAGAGIAVFLLSNIAGVLGLAWFTARQQPDPVDGR
ncbi:MAG TPA: hypothetical protein VKZ58_02460 [Longimicrobiales bacterium]|nr:hypothetical protein [Longimicrobiales bacterium]